MTPVTHLWLDTGMTNTTSTATVRRSQYATGAAFYVVCCDECLEVFSQHLNPETANAAAARHICKGHR